MSGFVYFAQGCDGGPIKIGYSVAPTSRIASLNTSSPQRIELLAVIAAPQRLEAMLHETFAESRIHGEWFAEDCPRLPEIIEAIISPTYMARDWPDLVDAVQAVVAHYGEVSQVAA